MYTSDKGPELLQSRSGLMRPVQSRLQDCEQELTAYSCHESFGFDAARVFVGVSVSMLIVRRFCRNITTPKVSELASIIAATTRGVLAEE